MTEITDLQEKSHFRPWALIVAMIAGPLAVTALTFWLTIPVYALVLGGPFYLAAGLPVAWWYLRQPEATAAVLPALAFAVNAALCLLGMVLFALIGMEEMRQMATIYLLFGSLFAPVWAVGTALIYRALLPARSGKDVTP